MGLLMACGGPVMRSRISGRCTQKAIPARSRKDDGDDDGDFDGRDQVSLSRALADAGRSRRVWRREFIGMPKFEGVPRTWSCESDRGARRRPEFAASVKACSEDVLFYVTRSAGRTIEEEQSVIPFITYGFQDEGDS